MHPLDALGHPARRRVLEVLVDGERSSGELVDIVGGECGISQSAISQHLGVLRDAGFVHVRRDGTSRLYSLDATPLVFIDDWLDRFRGFWEHRLSALDTEVARGKRQRRLAGQAEQTVVDEHEGEDDQATGS